MNKKTEKKRISSCDICMNYTYDEDYECYTCEVDLDEDEMAHFMQDTYYNCPYFQMGDEYKIGDDGLAYYEADRYKRTADLMIKDLSVKL